MGLRPRGRRAGGVEVLLDRLGTEIDTTLALLGRPTMESQDAGAVRLPHRLTASVGRGRARTRNYSRVSPMSPALPSLASSSPSGSCGQLPVSRRVPSTQASTAAAKQIPAAIHSTRT